VHQRRPRAASFKAAPRHGSRPGGSRRSETSSPGGDKRPIKQRKFVDGQSLVGGSSRRTGRDPGAADILPLAPTRTSGHGCRPPLAAASRAARRKRVGAAPAHAPGHHHRRIREDWSFSRQNVPRGDPTKARPALPRLGASFGSSRCDQPGKESCGGNADVSASRRNRSARRPGGCQTGPGRSLRQRTPRSMRASRGFRSTCRHAHDRQCPQDTPGDLNLSARTLHIIGLA
jgi:hypothetical protein